MKMLEMETRMLIQMLVRSDRYAEQKWALIDEMGIILNFVETEIFK